MRRIRRLPVAVVVAFSLSFGAIGGLLAGDDFVRGDANNDGRVSLADVQFIRNYLFLGGELFACPATSDVNDDVRSGKFRCDLYHRVRVVSLAVPALRERPEDLPGLVQLFLSEAGGEPPTIDADAIDYLRKLPWPGNVRELRNVIARLQVEHRGKIDLRAVQRVVRRARHGDPLSAQLAGP